VDCWSTRRGARPARRREPAQPRQKNWTAWIKPKRRERVHLHDARGGLPPDPLFQGEGEDQDRHRPGPIDLGWQPIAGDRIAFETIFTLMLPPHSKGVPDLSISDMREPFDTLIPGGQPLTEETGKRLAEWARGGASTGSVTPPPTERDVMQVGSSH